MIALTLLLAGAQLPVQEKLDQIDRTFICPETLPSDEARQESMALFVEQVRAVEPSLTIRNLTDYRQTLLVKHRCTKTLDYQEKRYGSRSK